MHPFSFPLLAESGRISDRALAKNKDAIYICTMVSTQTRKQPGSKDRIVKDGRINLTMNFGIRKGGLTKKQLGNPGVTDETWIAIEGWASQPLKDDIWDLIPLSTWNDEAFERFEMNPIMLYNHREPIGVWDEWEVVEGATPEESGLRVIGRVNRNWSDAWKVSDGILKTLSIQADIYDWRWNEELEAYLLTVIKLIEISVVDIPMLQSAVSELKSFIASAEADKSNNKNLDDMKYKELVKKLFTNINNALTEKGRDPIEFEDGQEEKAVAAVSKAIDEMVAENGETADLDQGALAEKVVSILEGDSSSESVNPDPNPTPDPAPSVNSNGFEAVGIEEITKRLDTLEKNLQATTGILKTISDKLASKDEKDDAIESSLGQIQKQLLFGKKPKEDSEGDPVPHIQSSTESKFKSGLGTGFQKVGMTAEAKAKTTE